jgi:membrane protein
MGFLLLISFLITAAISVLTDYIQSLFPDLIVYIAFVMDFIVSVGIITVLFAMIFKFLPDAKIRWKTVWIGAVITSVLFVLGKFLLGLYFGEANPGSTYGAAGTIVLILLWVSYSCLILFFGAQFTWVYAERYGLGIQPSSKKEKLKA